MLDRYARHLIQPAIDLVARPLKRTGITPNHLTIAGLLFGVAAGGTFFLGYRWLALGLLLVSGLLDLLDGSLARLAHKPGAWGGFLDVVSDRVVECAVIIFYALTYPDTAVGLTVLACAIILNLTAFLTVGAVAAEGSDKEFYYQAGITERTETFIFFVLFYTLPEQRQIWIYVFAALVFVTVVQRCVEAAKLFRQG